jgi:predicted transcriptional regulator
MSLNGNHEPRDVASLTSEIVSAYVTKNAATRSDLVALIGAVHSALSGLGKPALPEPEKPVPAVSIRKSVTSDYLVSLEDGKQYRTLKRHLTRLGLTPDQYRAKWGLPAEYPMVAPNYSSMRSKRAQESRLGQRRTPQKASAAKRRSTGARKTAK